MDIQVESTGSRTMSRCVCDSDPVISVLTTTVTPVSYLSIFTFATNTLYSLHYSPYYSSFTSNYLQIGDSIWKPWWPGQCQHKSDVSNTGERRPRGWL